MRKQISLLAGEKPIDNAPVIPLSKDEHCIPQHYLKFEHNLISLEKVVLDISYSEKYVIFAAEDKDQLFLQIGIIGFDNYRTRQEQSHAKIVYGRKWRVEPQLPTSEIIQTAFLALQKAREHEIRELFQVSFNQHLTTPFNNHHDLPLMSQKRAWMENSLHEISLADHSKNISQWLDSVRYDNAKITLQSLEQRANNKWLVDIQISPSATTQLPEMIASTETLIIAELDKNVLYFALMDLFLSKSNQHVEQHFRFKGFNRFSREHNVTAIGELSYKTRQREAQKLDDSFTQSFLSNNYETDKTRAPKLSNSKLGQKIRQQLCALNVGDGILPE